MCRRCKYELNKQRDNCKWLSRSTNVRHKFVKCKTRLRESNIILTNIHKLSLLKQTQFIINVDDITITVTYRL